MENNQFTDILGKKNLKCPITISFTLVGFLINYNGPKIRVLWNSMLNKSEM